LVSEVESDQSETKKYGLELKKIYSLLNVQIKETHKISENGAPLKIPTRNFDRVESRYQDIWIRGM